MKIGIISDNPNINSGYGEAGKNLGYQLTLHGHEVFFIGLQHRGAPVIVPIKDQLYRMHSGFVYYNGNGQNIDKAVELEKPDLLITVRDIVTFMPEGFQQAFKLRQWKGKVKLVSWVPIMEPYIMPAIKNVLLENSDFIVTYTDAARQFLMNEGVPYNIMDFINIGYDETVYRKTDPMLKLPPQLQGKKIFGFVGLLNDKRKQLGSLLKAFSYYSKESDDAVLYIHNNMQNGYNVAQTVEFLGLKGKILFPMQNNVLNWQPEYYYTDEQMASLFSSFHATVSMSAQEGFNMPFLESLACKTPVLGVESPFYDWSKEIVLAPSVETELSTGYGYVSDPYMFATYMHKIADKNVHLKDLEHLKWSVIGEKWNKLLERI